MCQTTCTSGPYFIKVKIVLSLKFKINLIFYFVKECKKSMFLEFFFEIEDEINIKVTINQTFRTPPRLKMNNSS